MACLAAALAGMLVLALAGPAAARAPADPAAPQILTMRTSAPVRAGVPRGLLPGQRHRPLARAAQVGCPGAFDVPTAATLAQARAATLCLVNFLRELHGIQALEVRRRLTLAARRHARDMVARRYFAHRSPDGRGLSDRLRASGYRFFSAAENLGAGSDLFGSPIGMVISWAESPRHLATMLDGEFWHVGLGLVDRYPHGGGGTTYTMIFASPW